MRPGGERGASALEILIVLALMGILLVIGSVSIVEFTARQELHAWSDIVANDLRAAQRKAISLRTPAQVRFFGRSGSAAATYSVTVDAATARRETLPLRMTLDTRQVDFDSWGVPVSAGVVELRLRHDRTSRTRTVTVSPSTGSVAVSAP